MDVVERLGELLREAGYGSRRTVDLRKLDGIIAPAATLTLLGRHEDARLALLTRLFTDCHTLARDQAQQVLAPISLDTLVGAGLLEHDGAGVRATLRVSDFEGLVLAG